MLPYYAISSDTFQLSVGARPLAGEPLIEVDLAEYAVELAAKAEILAADYRYYFQAADGSEPLQWEVVELLLLDLQRCYPAQFELARAGDRWCWHNRLLDTRTAFTLGDAATLPLPPLDWVGRQVQEDLLLMSGDRAAGFPLVAGQLCFPNRWSLDEKMGQSFLAIHGPVPHFADQVGHASHLLLDRLKEDRPVWRANWSLAPTAQLDLATRHRLDLDDQRREITVDNCGDRCFFRVERQTLARLARSGGVLFTVHTYRTPLAALAADPAWAASFLAVIESTPADFLGYKRIDLFREPLVDYLRRQSEAAA